VYGRMPGSDFEALPAHADPGADTLTPYSLSCTARQG
jgi:hypothetical protein